MIPNLLPALQAVRAHAVTATSRQNGAVADVDDADVIARGTYQGELSFLTPVHGSSRGDSPFGLSLAYGLAPRTELSLGLGALSGSPAYRRDERDEFGDLALGLKTQVVGGDFPIALAYQTTLLTSDRTQNDDVADQSVYAIGSQTLGRLEFVENLGATLPGSGLRRATPLYGGALVFDAGRGNAVTLQANRNQPQSAVLQNKLQYGLGYTHAFGRSLSLQAQLGQSGRGHRNTGLFLGGSFTFGSAR